MGQSANRQKPRPTDTLAVEELEVRQVLSGWTGLPSVEPVRFPILGDPRPFVGRILPFGPGPTRPLGDSASVDRPTITIDADWLAARGNGPYILDQANSTYILATDVRTAGTAFVVGAAGIVLDLNGHTITYGDAPPVQVRNGGFEEGQGRTVPGWDLSDARAASLAGNDSLLFGEQVLRLSHFRGIQRLVSDPIAIPKAGHSYTATVTPANPDSRSTLTLTVLDAITGRTLATGTSSAAFRGISAVAEFTPRTSNPVRLVITVTPPRGQADSLDLDNVTLTPSGDYGILAAASWDADIPGLVNLPDEARAASKKAAGFTVRNGSIVQGQADGYASSPLFFRGLRGFTVENVHTHATGTDTTSLDATYARDGIVVRGSTFEENIDLVTDRMKNHATLRLNDLRGDILVESNRFLGSPQAGVMLAANDRDSSARIVGNEFRQHAVVTNGYAIIVSAAHNFTLANNLIVPINGRGINLDGYNRGLLSRGEVFGNHVEVQETFNREYPTGLGATALRLRNAVGSQGPHRDLSIHDNVFIARTGPGQVPRAYGVRISYVNENGSMNEAGISLENNHISALATASVPGYRGRALALDRVDAGIDLRIARNLLESDDLPLAVAEGTDVRGAVLIANTYRESGPDHLPPAGTFDARERDSDDLFWSSHLTPTGGWRQILPR